MSLSVATRAGRPGCCGLPLLDGGLLPGEGRFLANLELRLRKDIELERKAPVLVLEGDSGAVPVALAGVVGVDDVDPIEVAAPTRVKVVLVSGIYPTSEGALDWKALLAEVPQQVLVTYHDPDGWLSGSGLADFVMPSANGSECEVWFGLTLKARCWRPVPGPQVIRVTVSETERWVSVTAAAPDDIVELVLARTEEEDAEPGETIRIGVLGLTDDGTEVYGMHASAADRWLPFPIAYEYDPDAEPQSLTVNAIGLKREFVYRGRLTWPDWRGESD